ncbi:MAG TPA: AMP-binding protein, partial [Myxococcota bacterium]|nr:AMP-binding protein [Myxococcota bacterium]
MSELAKFLAARDFLLAQRTDYAAAVRGFRWPELTHFNWALDYFDAMAKGDARIGLHVVEETGAEEKLSFAELAQRSNQAANFLRGLGVARGDRVLLMLGNEIALWEAMLACMKLGAVMIPATTLLAADDLRDRLARGQVKHVIAGAAHAAKFADAPEATTRIAVGAGASAAGWRDFADAKESPTTFVPDGPTRASDPLLLYFTSGTTSQPKLVLHTHASYPVGHLSTMYWLGLQP